MRHTERELARILHTGPSIWPCAPPSRYAGSRSTGCSTIWRTGASSSG